MELIKVSKVTVNIGVGESAEKLQKAEKLLSTLLGQKPVRTYAKASIPEFGVKKHSPLGVKVTLRGKKAAEFLSRALAAVENQIRRTQFDSNGNFSFGVKEYIEIPNTRYDPEIGMLGMDVSVCIERPGYRIAKRKVEQKKLPSSARINIEESIKFVEKKFNVQVV